MFNFLSKGKIMEKSNINKLTKKKVNEILNILAKTHPNAHCELNHRTPFQLLVATMLSAQSTDKTVNKVTDKLFCKYPTLEAFLELGQSELEQEIKAIGIYRNKAKNILGMCGELVSKFGGEVPSNMDDLVSLPGVGRKTANVVLSNAFGIPAIAVDTHVFRVSNRIGLAAGGNVEETEEQLMNNIPKTKWSYARHWLIWHGRRICEARKPKCEICPLSHICRYNNDIEGKKKSTL
jgi:endonuclease III